MSHATGIPYTNTNPRGTFKKNKRKQTRKNKKGAR